MFWTLKITCRPPIWDWFTSETESFCLSILEAMFFGCPAWAPHVGGIPEVVQDQITGRLVPFGQTDAMAKVVENLTIIRHCVRTWAARLKRAPANIFSAEIIVPRYEGLYRRVCA